MKIAVVVVTYNRKNSLMRLLNSLSKAYYNDEVSLIISIDKSKTDEVELFADQYEWTFGPKIVKKHEENLGLKKHILSVGNWLDEYDAIIVLEDDLVVSPSYYQFAKQAVEKYSDDSHIAGISLYSFSINYQNGLPFEPIKDENDVYFMQCAMSWGQVWMKKAWHRFIEWYSKNESFTISPSIPSALYKFGDKSWLKYHTRYCIENESFFVFPYTSFSTNFSEQGTNHHKVKGGNSSVFQVRLQRGTPKQYLLPEFSKGQVKYDGYFENLSLYDVLGINAKDVCIDLNGEKHNSCNNKYWLTTEKHDYKVLRSYGLSYTPIEENIIQNSKGASIYFYDTQVCEANALQPDINKLLYQYKISSMVQLLQNYGFKTLLKDIKYSLTRRIKRYVNKK